MLFSSFKPLKELDFQGNVAQMWWKKFIAEFDIFLCATDLDKKTEKRQVMCLLNVIGACGRAVMQFVEDGDKLMLLKRSSKNTVSQNKTNKSKGTG